MVHRAPRLRDRPAESATGAVTETSTGTFVPHELTITRDGTIWFTVGFTPQGVGKLDAATNAVTVCPLTAVGPEGIAASPDGSVWFTQTTNGNIARITADGVITEA